MKTCYIFGSALGFPKDFKPQEGDLVIGADAGYLKLESLGLTPHLTVGDFNSLGVIPQNCEIIKHPVKKDDTDTMLAVKIGYDRGYRNFCLCGCAGKRLDHTLANLQTLSYIAEKGGKAYLIGDDYIASAIKEDTISFNDSQKGNISVFSATDCCEVSITGLLYPVDRAKVTYDFPLGVSNSFIGKKAEITIHKGTAIIIWDR